MNGIACCMWYIKLILPIWTSYHQLWAHLDNTTKVSVPGQWWSRWPCIGGRWPGPTHGVSTGVIETTSTTCQHRVSNPTGNQTPSEIIVCMSKKYFIGNLIQSDTGHLSDPNVVFAFMKVLNGCDIPRKKVIQNQCFSLALLIHAQLWSAVVF